MLFSTIVAESTKKKIATLRTEKAPLIDGVVDDAVWSKVSPATDFFRYEPESGGHAPVKTEVRFLYDDVALYVAATMYDPDPSSIPRQLGKRDDDDALADWLGLWINPFNDGANEIGFLVTAAGVQVDAKYSPDGDDSDWNPVWSSEVAIHDQGWSVEMAIPFSQIRFPAKDIQTWGLNIARRRANLREIYTWTELDKAQNNSAQQAGLLLGIERIESPLRLSFTPYAAVSAEHYPFNEAGNSNFSSSYRGGMDLKYGINESFTLDMTLIPDFGQVQSDNAVLNLSPFEIRYDEHRPFFTEGTELLSKAGLFYSRRVGAHPIRYYQVADEEILQDGEAVISNPEETQMINATKVTGQTNNGVSLGFFNAITAATHASIADSLGNEREFLTNPLSNYNLVVIGKNMNNGSEVNLINTNVQRFAADDTSNDFRDANVIGYSTRLVSRDSKWVLSSSGGYDQLYYPDSISSGYRYSLEIEENQGVFQYGLGHSVESEYYNPNDMGYLRQPNEFSQFGWISLRTLDPVWKINYAHLSAQLVYSSLFNPRVYTSYDFNMNYNVTFKNYFSIGGGMSGRPREGHDYYEPRVEDRYYTTTRWFDSWFWISSNYNKPFSADIWVGRSAVSRRGALWWGGGFNPRWRVNDQLYLSYNLETNQATDGHGFADLDSLDNPVFGRRDQTTITNSLYSTFIFSRNLESELRVRYYRSALKYHDFYDLTDEGELTPRNYDADLNTVFGAFTVDAVITWRFLPGSEINITWKNAIYADGSDPDVPYLEDLKALPDLEQSNSISMKLLYYVDVWSLKHRL